MSRFCSGISQLYTRLLRLYPPSFRAEFADEMAAVFEQSLHEADNWLSLVGLLAGELRDLPPSILREHWRERARVIALAGGSNMTFIRKPDRTLRVSAWSALGVFAAYVLLVVLPFFALGLHLQPADLVRGGAFDPKGGFPYDSIHQASPLLLVMMMVWMVGLAPVWQTVWGSLLALVMWRHWRSLGRGQRLLGFLGLSASLFFLAAFTFSPLGRLMMIWIMD